MPKVFEMIFAYWMLCYFANYLMQLMRFMQKHGPHQIVSVGSSIVLNDQRKIVSTRRETVGDCLIKLSWLQHRERNTEGWLSYDWLATPNRPFSNNRWIGDVCRRVPITLYLIEESEEFISLQLSRSFRITVGAVAIIPLQPGDLRRLSMTPIRSCGNQTKLYRAV